MKEESFGQSLAVIEFDFLAKLSQKKYWDNTLFEVFQLVNDYEKNAQVGLNQENQAQLFLINQNDIFVKMSYQEKIEIYPNTIFQGIDLQKQYIFICVKNAQKELVKQPILDKLLQDIINLLEKNEIDYQLLDETNYQITHPHYQIYKGIQENIGFA